MTKVFTEAVSILNASAATVNIIRDTLIRLRARGVRFPDAEADRDFDEVCEVLRLMGEGIPLQLAAAMLEGEGDSQNAPTVDTIH
ncbi:MAG: hypothetical protein ACYC7K_00485 [Desulfobacteria bacterium]